MPLETNGDSGEEGEQEGTTTEKFSPALKALYGSYSLGMKYDRT